jgi:hypothetical protein
VYKEYWEIPEKSDNPKLTKTPFSEWGFILRWTGSTFVGILTTINVITIYSFVLSFFSISDYSRLFGWFNFILMPVVGGVCVGGAQWIVVLRGKIDFKEWILSNCGAFLIYFFIAVILLPRFPNLYSSSTIPYNDYFAVEITLTQNWFINIR